MNEDKTSPSFCNRIQKEATYFHIKCKHDNCTAEEIAIGGQILTGLKDINAFFNCYLAVPQPTLGHS